MVYGDWLGAPGAPTSLFYGHYDVQPVDPLNLWESPPFEATIRDGEIYARGSADDKGQVFMHFKAVEAHLKQNGRLPVNMKFILEGEEEVGSVNLDDFVHAHKGDLHADVVVISDSGMFARGVPSMCYGLRGLVYFQLDLRGANSRLAFDLATNRVVHQYDFPSSIAGFLSMVNDFQVDPSGEHVYIAETSPIRQKPALVVYDVRRQMARRVLEGHRSIQAGSYVTQTPERAIRVAGIELGCSAGEFSYHFRDSNTLLFALSDVIYILTRQP